MICALYSGGENFRHVSHNASRYLFRITSSPTCSRVATASRSRGRFDFSSGYRFSASSPRTLSVSASDRSTSKRYRSDHLALGHIKEAAPPPLPPIPFQNSPPPKNQNGGAARREGGTRGTPRVAGFPRTRSVRNQGFCWKWVRFF